MADNVNRQQPCANAAACCVELLIVVDGSPEFDVYIHQRHRQQCKDEAKQDYNNPSR